MSKKCPIDIHQLNRRMEQLNSKTELPWKPWYTQEGNVPSTDPDSIGYWALAATITFTVLVYVFENYLNQRQQKAYQQTEFPKQLEITVGKIDAELKASQKDKPATAKEETKEESKAKEDSEEDKDKPDRNAPLLPQLRSKFVKSQSYGTDKIIFGMISELYGTFETIAFLLLGFLPYMWDTAKEFGAKYGIEGEIGISLIFLLIVTLMGMVTSLPFELVRVSFYMLSDNFST